MILLLRLFKEVFQKVKLSIELRKYDSFTIAEYFRKQGAQIGENCYIVPRNLGTEPYLVKIGDHVCIAQGVKLNTHDGGTWIFRQELPSLRVFGPIIIEDNCLIGSSAQILPNVRIGRNSIVGAGSVVIADVPANSIVMGVPARQIGSVTKYKEKCIARWEIQRPPNLSNDGMDHYEKARDLDFLVWQLRSHLTLIFKDELEVKDLSSQ